MPEVPRSGLNMSKYFSRLPGELTAYVPGEQPRDMSAFIKLNTNESPFPPAPEVSEAIASAASRSNLYCDPTMLALRKALAKVYGLTPEHFCVGNGSDEILSFAFLAFCNAEVGAAFADITYGFYKVLGALYRTDCKILPLDADFCINPADYAGLGRTIFIANPNAPTGIALSLSEIEQILVGNPDNVVVIDQAYVDFGGESAIPLTLKYDNLLVVSTFSKSRSFAGGRVGFAAASPALIADLETVRNSINPYNVNSLSQAAAVTILENDAYYTHNCRIIAKNREYLTEQLGALGFETLPSKTNFVFTKHPRIGGKQLYLGLKERHILVRHFDAPRIGDFCRITVGTREQTDALLDAIKSLI